jgi:hypothetical protein
MGENVESPEDHVLRTTLRPGSWIGRAAPFLITNGILMEIKSPLAKVKFTTRPFLWFVRGLAWQSPPAKWRFSLCLHNTPGDVPNKEWGNPD